MPNVNNSKMGYFSISRFQNGSRLKTEDVGMGPIPTLYVSTYTTLEYRYKGGCVYCIFDISPTPTIYSLLPNSYFKSRFRFSSVECLLFELS